jgi:hypothetical protein
MTEITRAQMESLDAEISRLTDLLQGFMHFKHRTVRDVERDLGWGRGTLNRIFGGRSELKLRHILEVAATLDLNPEEFFHMAYMVLPKGATTVERIVAMLEILSERAGVKPKPPAAAPVIDLESLTPMMEEVVRRLLAETKAPDQPEAKAPEAPAKRGRRPRTRR